jgi:hypothetical protein
MLAFIAGIVVGALLMIALAYVMAIRQQRRRARQLAAASEWLRQCSSAAGDAVRAHRVLVQPNDWRVH